MTDTSPDAEKVLTDIFRRMSPARKWQRLADLYRTGKALHAAGYGQRHPAASVQEIHRDWLKLALGESVARLVWRRSMQPSNELLEVVREVKEAFEKLGVAYAVGGSLASSLYGKPRFTNDADVTVEPFVGQETALLSQFGSNYYVSLSAVQDALARRGSFNIIHVPSGFKVDVFVRKDRPFDSSAMSRRWAYPLPAPGEPSLMLLSPEDVILFKLEWYRLGGETSDQQWQDILGVLQTQGDRIDRAYLDQWAADLKVADLLELARGQPGS